MKKPPLEPRLSYARYDDRTGEITCALCGESAEVRRGLYGAIIDYRLHCDCSRPDTSRKVGRMEPAEGGGLDNLRTLCIPCHKAETAQLAKSRAGDRNLQMSLEGDR